LRQAENNSTGYYYVVDDKTYIEPENYLFHAQAVSIILEKINSEICIQNSFVASSRPIDSSLILMKIMTKTYLVMKQGVT
jgi:hypothetical protein